jgi:hypothetical protein
MPSGRVPASHSITMWGPPSTGKTTFLAALSVALIRRGPVWRVRGESEDSTKRLIELTTGLTDARGFPQATEGIGHYRWALEGRVKRRVRRWWLGFRQQEEDVSISLDLVDPQGKLASSSMQDRTAQGDLIANLESSNGIVFLFDPIREFDKGDAFEHTFGVLEQLSQRAKGASGRRLPHYVAVCVTKFDEVRVIATAEKLGLLGYDPDAPGFPRVADEDARELFAELCNVSRNGNGELVLNLLEQHFRADRIRYFVTSAIGFYVDPRKGRFDPDDYQNRVQPDPAKPEARIRGAIHPINVVEPVLWLSQRLVREPGE